MDIAAAANFTKALLTALAALPCGEVGALLARYRPARRPRTRPRR